MAKPPVDVRVDDTRLFTFIAIETSSKCNRSCTFCPVSHAPREDELMPTEMFHDIVDQLEDLNYKARVSLYSYNEPMRDERLIDFIKYTRAKLPRVCIMINTNGDYIKERSDIADLFLAGLNQMQINVYNAADGCGDPEKIARGVEKCEKRFAFLKDLVDSISWIDQNLSIYQHIGAGESACQVVPKWGFQPGSDQHEPTKVHGISAIHHMSNRAGNIPGFLPPRAEPLSRMCIRPFRALTINWRGDTILCCNDYHAEASSGNVREKSLVELWNDVRYHQYRVKLKAKDRRIFLCDTCDYEGGFYQHMTQAVTFGEERDAEIVAADMRSPEAAGFKPVQKLVQIPSRRRSVSE